MWKQFQRFVPFLFCLVLIAAGCSNNAPVSASPNLNATISAAIAATQTAQAPGGDDSISSQESGVESSQEAVQDNAAIQSYEPTSTPIFIESTSTPVIAATSADQAPPLHLPFSDNFDTGLRGEWRVINGKPLVSEGRLTSTIGELSMEIGNTTLTDYTFSLDVAGNDSCSNGYGEHLTITLSPALRFSYHYVDFGGRLIWSTFDSNDWVEIDRQDNLDCGRFEILVGANSYQIRINGSPVSDLIFDPAQGPLLVAIDEGVYIDNLEIR